MKKYLSLEKGQISIASIPIKKQYGVIPKLTRFMKDHPHIKLPHFSITGSFPINPPSNAKLDVSWYANGGIVISPQLIGVGEAGAEASSFKECQTTCTIR